MNTATPDAYLVREEEVRRLERLMYALTEAAKRTGPYRERTLAALREVVTAECPRCGVRVGGADLLELSRLPSAHENPHVARLRAGACVREGCSATRYRVTLQKHPDLDWAQLLSAESPPATAGEEQEVEPELEAVEGLVSRRRRLALRVAVLAVILLLVFVWRQLYFGGRIPLLREPEKFRVDPLPEGQTEETHPPGSAS